MSIHIPMAIVDILDNDGVSVGFEASSYSVSEGAGHVEVCLVMDGRTETEVECTITTQPGTASLGETCSTLTSKSIVDTVTCMYTCMKVGDLSLTCTRVIHR